MPLSGSYYYPMVIRPTSPELFGSIEVSASLALVSGSAAILLSGTNVKKYSNVSILIVNGGPGALGTVAVEASPNNVNWHEISGNFTGQPSGQTRSIQISENSRPYIRVRSTDTPAATAVTSSLFGNNG